MLIWSSCDQKGNSSLLQLTQSESYYIKGEFQVSIPKISPFKGCNWSQMTHKIYINVSEHILFLIAVRMPNLENFYSWSYFQKQNIMPVTNFVSFVFCSASIRGVWNWNCSQEGIRLLLLKLLDDTVIWCKWVCYYFFFFCLSEFNLRNLHHL